MFSVDFPFGFPFSVDPKNHIYKYCSCLSLLLLHVYPAYFIAASVREFFRGFLELKVGLAYLCLNFLSYFLWYSLNRQEKRIRRLVHMQRLLSPNRSTNSSAFFACVLACFTLLPFAYGGLSVYWLMFRNVDLSFYSLGYPVENSFLQCLLIYFCSYGVCLINTKWPCVALWSMCHVLNEGVNVLRVYNKRLTDSFSSRRSSSKRREIRVNSPEGFNMDESAHSKGSSKSTSSSSQPLLEILTEYFKIIKMIRLLKDTLSLPSLFITVLSFSSLYTVLALILFGGTLNETLLQEVLINGFTGISVIVSLGYCGAKLPQRMYEIRITCRNIINANEIDGVLDTKELSLLKRVEKVDLVHLSAFEFVVFSRSFIVTSFGSILTFGLLIFSLK